MAGGAGSDWGGSADGGSVGGGGSGSGLEHKETLRVKKKTHM